MQTRYITQKPKMSKQVVEEIEFVNNIINDFNRSYAKGLPYTDWECKKFILPLFPLIGRVLVTKTTPLSIIKNVKDVDKVDWKLVQVKNMEYKVLPYSGDAVLYESDFNKISFILFDNYVIKDIIFNCSQGNPFNLVPKSIFRVTKRDLKFLKMYENELDD